MEQCNKKKAAKLIVDKNMSMDEAKQKATKEAIRNSAIILAAYGAYAVHDLAKFSRTL